jgi:hypothetical protein
MALCTRTHSVPSSTQSHILIANHSHSCRALLPSLHIDGVLKLLVASHCYSMTLLPPSSGRFIDALSSNVHSLRPRCHLASFQRQYQCDILRLCAFFFAFVRHSSLLCDILRLCATFFAFVRPSSCPIHYSVYPSFHNYRVLNQSVPTLYRSHIWHLCLRCGMFLRVFVSTLVICSVVTSMCLTPMEPTQSSQRNEPDERVTILLS